MIIKRKWLQFLLLSFFFVFLFLNKTYAFTVSVDAHGSDFQNVNAPYSLSIPLIISSSCLSSVIVVNYISFDSGADSIATSGNVDINGSQMDQVSDPALVNSGALNGWDGTYSYATTTIGTLTAHIYRPSSAGSNYTQASAATFCSTDINNLGVEASTSLDQTGVSTITESINTLTVGAWVVGGTSGVDNNVNAGTNMTVADGQGASSQYVLRSTNSPIGLPSNVSVTSNMAGGSHAMGMALMSLAPVSGGSSSLPSSTINYLFPVSSTVVASPQNILFKLNNLIGDHNYSVDLIWHSSDVVGGNYSQHRIFSVFGNSLSLLSNGLYGGGVDFFIGDAPDWQVVFNQTSTLFYSSVILRDTIDNSVVLSSDFDNWRVPSLNFDQSLATTTTAVFINNNSSSVTFSTSTSVVSVTNPFITSSTSFCTPAANILDVGGGIRYGLCWSVNLLFRPNQSLVNAVLNQVNVFKGVPPFSIYFDITTAYRTALDSFNNSTSTGLSVGILGFNNEQVTIFSLSSTTFYGKFAHGSSTAQSNESKMRFLFGYVGSVLLCAIGYGIFKLIRRA